MNKVLNNLHLSFHFFYGPFRELQVLNLPLTITQKGKGFLNSCWTGNLQRHGTFLLISSNLFKRKTCWCFSNKLCSTLFTDFLVEGSNEISWWKCVRCLSLSHSSVNRIQILQFVSFLLYYGMIIAFCRFVFWLDPFHQWAIWTMAF